VLAEHHVGPGKAVEEPVIDHGLRPLGGLLGRLEDGQERTAPRIGSPRQERRRPRQARGVHVVAAGVRNRYLLALPVGGRLVADVGQTGLLPDRQGVHVGAQHHGRPLAVLEQTHHPGLTDASSHLEPGRFEPLGRLAGGALLLHGQLGVGVQVLVEVFEVRQDAVESSEDGVGTVGRGHDSTPLDANRRLTSVPRCPLRYARNSV
jgi:hypothetical protein